MTNFSDRMSLLTRHIGSRALPVTALIAVSVLAVSCGSAKQPVAQPSNTTPTQSTSSTAVPTSGAPTSQPTAAPTSRPMKQLAIKFGSGRWQATVLLTVPSTWQLSKTQPGSCCRTPPTVCVVEAGSDYAGNLSNCRLAVTYSPAVGPMSPNEQVPPARYSTCRNWSTAQESSWTISGRPGEYRRFVNNCSGASYEQWTVMTGPQVAFWHPITEQCGHALAAGIVDSAVLPPQTDSARQFDVGYIRQISKRADGYYVRLDRVVPNLDGSVTNLNPATYDYRLDGLASIPGMDRCDQWGNLACNMSYLLSQFAKGAHPADGSLAVDGAFAYLVYDGARYQIQVSQPSRFR